MPIEALVSVLWNFGFSQKSNQYEMVRLDKELAQLSMQTIRDEQNQAAEKGAPVSSKMAIHAKIVKCFCAGSRSKGWNISLRSTGSILDLARSYLISFKNDPGAVAIRILPVSPISLSGEIYSGGNKTSLVVALSVVVGSASLLWAITLRSYYPGSLIPRHRDNGGESNGTTLVSVLELRKARRGGEFRCEKILIGLPRFTVFVASKHSHEVTRVEEGTRLILMQAIHLKTRRRTPTAG